MSDTPIYHALYEKAPTSVRTSLFILWLKRTITESAKLRQVVGL